MGDTTRLSLNAMGVRGGDHPESPGMNARAKEGSSLPERLDHEGAFEQGLAARFRHDPDAVLAVGQLGAQEDRPDLATLGQALGATATYDPPFGVQDLEMPGLRDDRSVHYQGQRNVVLLG